MRWHATVSGAGHTSPVMSSSGGGAAPTPLMAQRSPPGQGNRSPFHGARCHRARLASMVGCSKMGRGKSRQGAQLALVSHGDVGVEGEVAAGPTLLERASLALRATRRRKWIAAAVFLLGADASVVYYRLRTPVYRVEAIVARRPQDPASARPDGAHGASKPSASELVHQRETLIALIDEAILPSPHATRLASPDLPGLLRRPSSAQHPDSTAGSDPTAVLLRRLDQALEVTTGNGTIAVAVEWPDPEQAHRMVQVLLKRLAEQAGESLGEVIKPAEVPKNPVKPDPFRVFGIGVVASLLLAVVVAVAFDSRSGRVVQPRQVENRAGRRARREARAPVTPIATVRATARRVGSGSDHFQELWSTLARKSWRSLVLVPADEGESVAAIAASLVNVGRRVRRGSLTFLIIADSTDYESAARIMAALEGKPDEATGPAATSGAQVVAAIQPVIAEPLGLSIAQAADVSIVCAEAGRTRLAAARRTIDLVGRERIAACLVVPPTAASSQPAPPRAPVPAEPLRHELQQMWLSLMRGDWSSLVVVPTDADIPARDVVAALQEGAASRMGRFRVIDAVGVSTDDGERLAREMAAVVAGGTRVIVPVDSLMQCLSGAHLVRDAEAALLVVRLGASNLKYVQSTIDLVGRERILGAVTLPR